MNSTKPKEPSNLTKDLRSRAEDALRGKPVELDDLSKKDVQYLLHELQVHQAELTLQNEELRQVQFDLETSRDLYADLYDFAPAGYCTLSQKGRILNANKTLGDMLEMDPGELLHHDLSEFVDGDSQDVYYLHCQKTIKDHQRAINEIRLIKQSGERLIIRIESKISWNYLTQMMMLSDVTEQRQIENLQQENAARIILQRRLIAQSEKERLELARNLHDGPMQRLAGLGFSVQVLKDILKEADGKIEPSLQQMGIDIKDLIAELRGICNAIRPPVLSKLGLRRAIAENIVDLRARYSQTEIHLEVTDDVAHLPDPIALSIYRIYQEAMMNIYHHSHASEVWIRISFLQQQLFFEIQDNGQGISEQVNWNTYALQGHYGLVGIKERAELFGGTVQLFSPPGQGTILQVRIPALP